MHELDPDLVDRALVRWPTPLADSISMLQASASDRERRDRIVEVSRVAIRLLAALAFAARLQFGPGPTGEHEEARRLLVALRRRTLTDGQWVGLARTLLKPWSDAPDEHPLPEAVRLVGHKAFARAIDGLLQMRRTQTVAHGITGDDEQLADILATRIPQLQTLLEELAVLWEATELAMPLASGEAQPPAWRLVGVTPGHGRWRRRTLTKSVPAGQLVLSRGSEPVLALHPVVQLRRPTPEDVEEVFVLDGSGRRGQARLLALPSLAEHLEESIWAAVDPILQTDGDTEEGDTATLRPYRGLDAFTVEHAALFHGREEQSEALANRIRRQALVTVTGASGAGKSSLVAAGVLPRLADLDVRSLRPGPAPVEALARALDLPVELLNDPRAAARELEVRARDAGSLVVVWVDQAEELLTLGAETEEVATFTAAIAALGSDAAAPLRVVLSVREDFFARLAGLEALQPLAGRHVEVVAPLDRAALLRTLVLPAQGLGFTFEEGLAETMVDAVADVHAPLPLLQFCADRLWERRDRSWKRLSFEAYRALGGVEGALATHAESVAASLPAARQRSLRLMFRRLVTAERTRAVVPTSELTALPDGEELLRSLEAARLLQTREDPGLAEPRVEIVHEALLVHWDRLGRWLDEDQAGRRTLQSLRQATSEWEGRGRPDDLLWRGELAEELARWLETADDQLTAAEREFAGGTVQLLHAAEEAERQQRVRRQRLALGVAGVASVVAVAVAGLAFVAWDRAQVAEQALTAEKERLVRAYLAQGDRAVDEGDSLRALPAYAEVLRLVQHDPDRAEAARARLAAVLHELPQLDAMLVPPGPEMYLALAADGRIAMATEGTDTVPSVLAVHDDRGWNTTPFGLRPFELEWLPDGRLLVGGNEPNKHAGPGGAGVSHMQVREADTLAVVGEQTSDVACGPLWRAETLDDAIDWRCLNGPGSRFRTTLDGAEPLPVPEGPVNLRFDESWYQWLQTREDLGLTVLRSRQLRKQDDRLLVLRDGEEPRVIPSDLLTVSRDAEHFVERGDGHNVRVRSVLDPDAPPMPVEAWDTVSYAVFGDGGDWLAVKGQLGQARLWDIDRSVPLTPRLGRPNQVMRFVLDEASRRMLVAEGGVLTMWSEVGARPGQRRSTDPVGATYTLQGGQYIVLRDRQFELFGPEGELLTRAKDAYIAKPSADQTVLEYRTTLESTFVDVATGEALWSTKVGAEWAPEGHRTLRYPLSPKHTEPIAVLDGRTGEVVFTFEDRNPTSWVDGAHMLTLPVDGGAGELYHLDTGSVVSSGWDAAPWAGGLPTGQILDGCEAIEGGADAAACLFDRAHHKLGGPFVVPADAQLGSDKAGERLMLALPSGEVEVRALPSGEPLGQWSLGQQLRGAWPLVGSTPDERYMFGVVEGPREELIVVDTVTGERVAHLTTLAAANLVRRLDNTYDLPFLEGPDWSVEQWATAAKALSGYAYEDGTLIQLSAEDWLAAFEAMPTR